MPLVSREVPEYPRQLRDGHRLLAGSNAPELTSAELRILELLVRADTRTVTRGACAIAPIGGALVLVSHGGATYHVVVAPVRDPPCQCEMRHLPGAI
jgi:hypothetical protein